MVGWHRAAPTTLEENCERQNRTVALKFVTIGSV